MSPAAAVALPAPAAVLNAGGFGAAAPCGAMQATVGAAHLASCALLHIVQSDGRCAHSTSPVIDHSGIIAGINTCMQWALSRQLAASRQNECGRILATAEADDCLGLAGYAGGLHAFCRARAAVRDRIAAASELNVPSYGRSFPACRVTIRWFRCGMVKAHTAFVVGADVRVLPRER